MLQSKDFFHLEQFEHRALFAATKYVWQALPKLKEYIATHVPELPEHQLLQDGMPLTAPLVFYEGELLDGGDLQIEYGDATKGKLRVSRGETVLEGASVLMAGAVLLGRQIGIGRGVLIEAGALIKEPTIIGDRTEVRQGAYLRGNCLFGKRCVVGHTTEVKHSVFLDDAKAGHFAYLGDSILGGNANLGAGTKMANLRFLPGNVQVKTREKNLDSGLRKFGAILGDDCQTGCNSVTNPGTVLGPGSMLMPNTTCPSGYHPPKSVIR
jgi:bifunctional N-acetylglucosamine-1-phosphate-uridyltransferase/glucosamine-1-phosphate-acetyltransferase GlmU-like protein